MIRRVIKAAELPEYGAPEFEFPTGGGETTDSLRDATVITSEMDFSSEEKFFLSGSGTRWHAPVLDLDFPATLIPSSTPGHYHLYLDTMIPEDKYFALLDALADAGVVEPGYVVASKKRGYTAVRLPWVEK